MTLDRDTVLAGIENELAAFADLVRPLTRDELGTPTRCQGWTVAHVAGHVVGTAVDVVNGDIAGQGTPEVTQRQADSRAERSGDELADELEAVGPRLLELLGSLPAEAWSGPSFTDPSYTLGFGVEAIWYDLYLHGDDIRHALGRPAAKGDGLRAALHHVAGYLEHGGYRPVTFEFAGFEPIHVFDGGSPSITGDPHDVLLAATGRLDPAAIGLDPAINVYQDA